MLEPDSVFSFRPPVRESFQTPTGIMSSAITSNGCAFLATQLAMLWAVIVKFPSVLSIGCKNQIIRRIVLSIFVFMVNLFVRLKKSPNLFLHYQSVLSYSPPRICVWVISANNNQISVTEASPFKVWVSFWASLKKLEMTFSASGYCFSGYIKDWLLAIKAIALSVFSYVH